MKSLDIKINEFFDKFIYLTPWFLRFGLGISFFFHGYGKFPLPPQKLIDYFGFSEALASFVAIAELSAGVLLIIGGFIKDYLGSLITRFGALNIVIIMLFALGLAHRDWLITPKLFMSEQIFLLLIGLYFLIRGNK
ncbi:MAG: DoxX family protein [Methylophilaceae bacterium]|tara:strand:+ start:74 stop:481 length:408 start_codon:yes stop_codon:yes gene_type:complete